MQKKAITSHFIGLTLESPIIQGYFGITEHTLTDLLQKESFVMRHPETPHITLLYLGYRACDRIAEIRSSLLSLGRFDEVADNTLAFVPHITLADIDLTQATVSRESIETSISAQLSDIGTLHPTGLDLYRVSSLVSPEVQERVDMASL